jgi:hypothetical protein
MWRKRNCQQNRLRKKSSHGTSNCMCPYADGETMTKARLAVCLVAFTLALVVCGKADAQKVDAPSPTSQQHILSLNFTNNGQHLIASVGQQIEITRRRRCQRSAASNDADLLKPGACASVSGRLARTLGNQTRA